MMSERRRRRLIVPSVRPTRREVLAGLALTAGGLAGCSRFDASSWFSRGRYDVDRRFRESVEELGSPPSPALADDSRWSALVISDPHFWEDEYNTSLLEVGDYVADYPVDFLLVLGDIADAGYPGEFTTAVEMLEAFELPYYGCLGNHDVWHDGWTEFRLHFGASVYELHAGAVLFLAVDTAGATLGVPQRGWLEERLAESTAEHIIVMTHYPLWSPTTEGFSQCASEQEVYDILDLMRRYGVTAHLSGHTHRWAYTEFDGTGLYTVGSIKEAHADRCGLRIDASAGELTFTLIPFPYVEEGA